MYSIFSIFSVCDEDATFIQHNPFFYSQRQSDITNFVLSRLLTETNWPTIFTFGLGYPTHASNESRQLLCTGGALNIRWFVWYKEIWWGSNALLWNRPLSYEPLTYNKRLWIIPTFPCFHWLNTNQDLAILTSVLVEFWNEVTSSLWVNSI